MSKYIYFSTFTFLFTIYAIRKRNLFYDSKEKIQNSRQEIKLIGYDDVINKKQESCWCCDIKKMSCSTCGKKII